MGLHTAIWVKNKMKKKFHNSILRAYDIRGVIGETLNTEDAYALGYKFSCFVRKKQIFHEL